MQHVRPRRRLRDMRGFNLIGVIIASAVMTVVGLAVMGALSVAFKTGRESEPKLVAQNAVSNVQTDLNALAMYDNSVIANLSTGKTITVDAAPTPSSGSHAYAPADTMPTTVTIKGSSGVSSGSTAATLQVNYVVTDASSRDRLTGNAVISVAQKAPGGCDSHLSGKSGAQLPDGTNC